jgi:DNA-binding MarR family transcriptional regulator
MERLTLSDYQSLAELRYQVRKFVHFSELAARKAGMEPRQHQLLLAIKGMPKDVRPRIGELAKRLQLQHHSTVELANRLARRGYIRRRRDSGDRREVLLDLTAKGESVLRRLSLDHRQELRNAGPMLMGALLRVLGSAPRRSTRKT